MERFKKDRSLSAKRGNVFAALPLYASMLAVNHLAREPFVVRAGDSVKDKLIRAYPSALAAPEVTGNRMVDSLAAVGMAAVSIEAGRRIRNGKELAVTAITAHGAATIANVAVDHLGLLDEEERKQEDVGFSAVAIALGIDFMLHRADYAKSIKTKAVWRAGAAALAGGSVVGSYAAKDKLAASAHAAGAVVGGAAYLANRNK